MASALHARTQQFSDPLRSSSKQDLCSEHLGGVLIHGRRSQNMIFSLTIWAWCGARWSQQMNSLSRSRAHTHRKYYHKNTGTCLFMRFSPLSLHSLHKYFDSNKFSRPSQQQHFLFNKRLDLFIILCAFLYPLSCPFPRARSEEIANSVGVGKN